MRKGVKNGPQSTHMRNIMLLVSSTPTVVGIVCRLISEKACTYRQTTSVLPHVVGTSYVKISNWFFNFLEKDQNIFKFSQLITDTICKSG
jgi:hypothetical protein